MIFLKMNWMEKKIKEKMAVWIWKNNRRKMEQKKRIKIMIKVMLIQNSISVKILCNNYNKIMKIKYQLIIFLKI